MKNLRSRSSTQVCRDFLSDGEVTTATQVLPQVSEGSAVSAVALPSGGARPHSLRVDQFILRLSSFQLAATGDSPNQL